MEPISIEKINNPEHEYEKYYNLKEGDIFVEAGANWGQYIEPANRKKCSKIILIEPSPVNIITIENLLSIKGFDKSKNIIVSRALHSKKEKVNFVVDGNPNAHTILNKKTLEQNKYLHLETEKSITTEDWLKRIENRNNIIEVQGDTLDNILTELNIDYVDLFAADIEGAEIKLSKFAKKYLAEKRIKNVAIAAYHLPSYGNIVIKILKKNGYKDISYDGCIVYAHI